MAPCAKTFPVQRMRRAQLVNSTNVVRDVILEDLDEERENYTESEPCSDRRFVRTDSRRSSRILTTPARLEGGDAVEQVAPRRHGQRKAVLTQDSVSLECLASLRSKVGVHSSQEEFESQWRGKRSTSSCPKLAWAPLQEPVREQSVRNVESRGDLQIKLGKRSASATALSSLRKMTERASKIASIVGFVSA
eukprot:TRINITY_DN68734_c0_g1_i1.p1 TRINITY_DN68734_c0_g1~~TRINITY_DN68734_c0_g1_i1.p1  ORF type:complete len:214 (+),score=21.73 TRINITY_DN68734_c0_g1_i1:69-644(+)